MRLGRLRAEAAPRPDRGRSDPFPFKGNHMDFALIRPIFGGRLRQSQVDGIGALLAATEGLPRPWRAYLLATPVVETARTMQPIMEFGSRSYFNKYEPGTTIGKRLGNTVAGDGYLFRGRGYVQITGRDNYLRAGRFLGRDLIADPDLALDPVLAGRILVQGCADGWFTGKRLADYLDRAVPDYLNARRIVNGLDRAAEIAGYARTFEAALR